MQAVDLFAVKFEVMAQDVVHVGRQREVAPSEQLHDVEQFAFGLFRSVNSGIPFVCLRATNPNGKMAIVILLLIFCGAMLLLDLMLCGFVKKCLIQKNEEMNEIMLFLLLCALGALCYGFYFKCVDWFEKI